MNIIQNFEFLFTSNYLIDMGCAKYIFNFIILVSPFNNPTAAKQLYNYLSFFELLLLFSLIRHVALTLLASAFKGSVEYNLLKFLTYFPLGLP